MSDHLPDGFYWAEDIATLERSILRVRDGYFSVAWLPGGGGDPANKVKHIRDRYLILTEIKEPE